MLPESFSISFSTVEEPDRACTTPTPSRVLHLLDDHRPWKMLNNMALIMVDQTYTALLELLGPAAADDGHVEASRPVDSTDPDSPVLSVNASATHCSISLIHSLFDTSPKHRNRRPRYHDYLFARASVSVSPGTLHVQARAAADYYWKCADDDVRPNVAEKGLLGVLETIMARLDAAITVEANLIEVANKSGCGKSPKLHEIIDVRVALERMRRELDLDAIMRRRRHQKQRRGTIQETYSRSDDTDMVDDADVLTKRFGALQGGQKRCQPADEMDNKVDDADVLTKRLRALHV